MKFAFCLYKYFPYSGLSRDFLRILVECQRRGHQAEVFVSSWQGSPPVKSTNVTILGEWGENFLPNHVKDRRYYRRLRRQLKARSFDAIIGFNRMPGLDVYYGQIFAISGEYKKRILLYLVSLHVIDISVPSKNLYLVQQAKH